MAAKKLLGAYLRGVSGLAVGALFWFAVGWALSSMALGFVLAVWTALLGPVLIPLFTWLWMRSRGHVRRVPIAKDPSLARDYFERMLAQPGPEPRLWVRPGTDLTCLWFQTPWPASRRQEVVVTTAWMNQPAELRAKDFETIWSRIIELTPMQRRWRTCQMAAWCGMLSPFEVLVYALGMLLEFLGATDVPGPSFWLQRGAWQLRALWFGLPADSGHLLAPAELRRSRFEEPAIWSSLLWGTWFQLPERACHPLWWLLTHRSALLES